MNEPKHHDHDHHQAHSHPPRWKRVHHSWIFWVAVFLMLLAIITYVPVLTLWLPDAIFGP